ncbi:MAG: hypothetical protein IT197_11180 [Acidimicrobiia bacterium]|nr:hypothetical protein [Acidimicrobiia bacterium]
MKRTIGMWAVVLLVTGTLAGPAAAETSTPPAPGPAAAAHPTVSVFTYTSSPGDYIGQGARRTFTDAETVFSGSLSSPHFVEIVVRGEGEWWTGEYWRIWFAAPDGAPLAPGTYTGAERHPFESPGAPGLSMFGTGRGCNRSYGSFTVHSIEFEGSGELSEFSADFVQHCETPTAPPVTGSVRYRVPATTQVEVLGLRPPSEPYRASGWSSPASLAVGGRGARITLDGSAEFIAGPGALGRVDFTSRRARFGPPRITVTLTDPTLGAPVEYRTVLVVPFGPGTVLGLAVAPPGSQFPALLYKVTAGP